MNDTKSPVVMLKTAIGLISIIASALIIFNFRTADLSLETAGAINDGNERYESNWKATHLLRAQRIAQDGGWRDGIAFGVARWKVTGSFVPNGPYWTEEWRVPSGKPVFESNRGGYGRIATHVSVEFPEGDSDKWLVGFLSPHNIFQTRHIISEMIADWNPGTTYTVLYNSRQNFGKAISCHGDFNCYITRGSYAFEDYFAFASATNGKHRNVAVAIPLEWKVEGRICQTRQECQ